VARRPVFWSRTPAVVWLCLWQSTTIAGCIAAECDAHQRRFPGRNSGGGAVPFLDRCGAIA
jgi:hypothetical protein